MSRCKPTFSPETPHFFKIIHQETLSEEKLRIPNKFWRNYGGTLDEKVFVELPCGSEWEMKLTKHKGKFWLKAGWPEFAKRYALEIGDLLVFRYEGNSKFRVVIFDTTTVEIDYPFVPRDEGAQEDGISPSCPKRTGEKPPLRSPRPRKRTKAGPNAKPRRDPSSPKPEDESQPEMKGKGDSNAKGDAAERKTKPLSGSEKLAALQKASGFKSERPYVKILIQPSYARKSGIIVPSSFANKYLKNKSGSLILRASGGRTWPAKYHRYESRYRASITRIWSGWQDFACDNRIKAGDVCVFSLLKGTESSYEVVIFRDSVSTKAPISPDLEGGSVKEEGNSPANEFDQSGTSPAKKKNEGTSMPLKTSMKPKRKAIRKKRLFYKAEKDRILERVRYNSGNPFFKVVIQPSYAVGTYLGVPSKFVKKYIKKEGDIVLSDTTGRSWSAQLVTVRPANGYSAASIRDGWRVFADENNLEAGDVCVFELVEQSGAKTAFKVSIIRVSDYDN